MLAKLTQQAWLNCEVIVYTFATDDAEDDGKMVEYKHKSAAPENATDGPTAEETL